MFGVINAPNAFGVCNTSGVFGAIVAPVPFGAIIAFAAPFMLVTFIVVATLVVDATLSPISFPIPIRFIDVAAPVTLGAIPVISETMLMIPGIFSLVFVVAIVP